MNKLYTTMKAVVFRRVLISLLNSEIVGVESLSSPTTAQAMAPAQ